MEKGRYNTTDAYIYHIAMTRSGKEILLLTDKRVAYLKSNDIFGGWQVCSGIILSNLQIFVAMTLVLCFEFCFERLIGHTHGLL